MATGAAVEVTNVALTIGLASTRITVEEGGAVVVVAEISAGTMDAGSKANGGTTGREVDAPSDRGEAVVVGVDHSGICLIGTQRPLNPDTL